RRVVRADRRVWSAARWYEVRRRGRAPERPALAVGSSRHDGHRKIDDVCARARAGVLRRAGSARHRPRSGASGLSLHVRPDRGRDPERAIPNEAIARQRSDLAAKREVVLRSSMFITKMSLPRRSFLRGVGTALALPLLDAMVPALSAMAETPAKRIRRLRSVHLPNGASVN